MTSTRVFVLQDDGKRDFRPAMVYGELVPVVERDVFPDDVEQRIVKMQEILYAKLADFKPARDYVLLTGDPVLIMLAGIFFGTFEAYERIMTLKFDRENGGYYVVPLQIN